MPQRIALVGPVASGKSTLAAAITAHTGLPHLDLDELFWGPDRTGSAAPVPASDGHSVSPLKNPDGTKPGPAPLTSEADDGGGPAHDAEAVRWLTG